MCQYPLQVNPVKKNEISFTFKTAYSFSIYQYFEPKMKWTVDYAFKNDSW